MHLVAALPGEDDKILLLVGYVQTRLYTYVQLTAHTFCDVT